MSRANWLDRRIAHPGPRLALVLSQSEFDAAMRHCEEPTGASWIKNSHSDATSHYLRDQQGELVCVVALAGHDGRNPVEVAGLLVHEAVHVWQEYCDSIGEDQPGREQEAYAIQAISQELMAEYARRMSGAE